MVHRTSHLRVTKLCARIFDLCRFDGGFSRFGTRHFADRHFDESWRKIRRDVVGTFICFCGVSLAAYSARFTGSVIVPPCGAAGVRGKVDRCCKPGIGEGHHLAINPRAGIGTPHVREDDLTVGSRWKRSPIATAHPQVCSNRLRHAGRAEFNNLKTGGSMVSLFGGEAKQKRLHEDPGRASANLFARRRNDLYSCLLRNLRVEVVLARRDKRSASRAKFSAYENVFENIKKVLTSCYRKIR